MAVVCIFGSGGCLPGSFEYDSALLLGEKLAQQGYDIATGAYAGVMEAALKGAKDFNVRRIGVTTDFYHNRKPNPFVTEVVNTNTYLERMEKLIELGDAYIVLPGGTGTLLELSAVWSLKNRNIINDKPLITLGEQWHELIQTMSFFSEEVIDNIELVKTTQTVRSVVDHILEKVK